MAALGARCAGMLAGLALALTLTLALTLVARGGVTLTAAASWPGRMALAISGGALACGLTCGLVASGC